MTGLPAGSYSLDFVFSYYNNDIGAYLGSHQFWGHGNSSRSASYFDVGMSEHYVLASDYTIMDTADVSGTVTNNAGNPLKGYAVAWDASYTSAKTSNIVEWIPTRADGSYTLPKLAVGTFRIGFVVGQYVTPYSSTGGLGTSETFVSEFWNNVGTYSTATDVVVGPGGVTGINAVMGFGFPTPPAPPWADEQVGGQNPSENNCECGHGDPVSSATGEFYENDTDVAIPGVGPTLAAERNYSSAKAATDGAFGFGWSSLLDSRVRVIDAGTGWKPQSVEVVQENGSVVPFSLDVDNQYVAPNPRARATLDWDGLNWTFTRHSTEILTFNSDGAFTSQRDLNSNSVVADYDSGHIATLTASGGRLLTLTWSGDHVRGITDSASRTVTYNYTSSGELTSVTGIDGQVTSYGYGTDHYLTIVTEPGGAVTTNVYDGSHRVTSQTDPVGRLTTFDYSGDTTTITSPSGAKTRDRYYLGQLVTQTVGADTAAAATTYYYYDDSGNLVQLVDPLGHTTTNKYDAGGNVTSEKFLNIAQTSAYDGAGNVVYTQDWMGRVSGLTYDSHENLLSALNPANHSQSWTRNADGTAATSTDGDGKVTTYSYDAAGRLLSTTDPLGHVTSVTYDDAGRVLTATDGEGQVTTFTVDAYGRTLTKTDPNSNTTSYSYDVRGNQTSITDANGSTVSSTFNLADEVTSSTDALGKITTLTYTPDGYLWQSTDPNNHTTTDAYDVRGNMLSSTDPAGHTTSFIFDLDDHQVKVTQPTGAFSTMAYDGWGHLSGVTDALGKTTVYGFNLDGTISSVTDPLNRSTYTSYFADGRVSAVTFPNSSFEKYIYDARGNVTQFTNADGLTTTYAYDDASRLTSKTEPGGLVTSYTYDHADRVLTTTRPNASVVTNNYDDAGRLASIHDSTPGSVDTTFGYDAVGERTIMIDSTGTTSYIYSARGQLTSVTNGAVATIGYGYDDAGQRTSIVYPGSKTVTYGYDAAGNISSVTDWNAKATTFTWTADNRLSTQTGPDTIVETRLYDLADRPLSITTKKGTTQVAKYSYTYDAAGQSITDTTVDPTTTSLAHTYTYDTVNQLKSTKTGSTTLTYTATPGNELTKAASGEVFTYNATQELTKIQPTTGAATTFVYNANGSRTSSTVAAAGSTPAATTTYTYTPSGSLASAVVPGTSGGTVTYTANGDGLRQSRAKGSSTTQFLWDPNAPVPQMLTDGTQWYIYGPSTTPIAQIDKASGVTTQYLHADKIGSVRLITSSTGTTAGANTFDPFGKRTVHTGTSDSAMGFTGAWTDITTGLVYLRARDYDPKSSQFMIIDPAVDLTRDPYAYVSNNPLAATDPLGLWDINDDFLYPMLTTGITGHITNAIVGFGDGASFGITHLITNALFPDVDCKIESDGSYTAGLVVGAVASTVATGGTGGVAAASQVARAGELLHFAEMAGQLPDELTLVRGGTNAVDRFLSGSGVTADGAGNLSGVSVNSGRTVEEAAQGIQHGQIGTTTVGDVRSAGGQVTSAPTANNIGHCLISGCTAQTLSDLFTPTIPNIWR